MSETTLPTRAHVLAQLFHQWHMTPQTETIPVSEAIGRILAKDALSLNTLPVVRASGCDGIAVHSEAFQNGIPNASQWKEGIDYVHADTGDDFDDAFDAIVRMEDVTLLEHGGLAFADHVEVEAGTDVRPRGNTVALGEFLLKAGVPLRPIDLAALVTGGLTSISVYRRPIVAFIPTGSELVPAGTDPLRGQMVDANSILAKETLLSFGAIPLCYPIVKDAPRELEAALDQALSEADIVIINGGSSKGVEDYNTQLLQKRGELLCHGVAAAPGRPIGIAVIQNKPVVNLPGPTSATFYGLDWCIRAIVNRFLDRKMQKRETMTGTLTRDIALPSVMEFLNKMDVQKYPDGSVAIIPLPMRETRPIASMTSNAMFVNQIGGPAYRAGDEITVELLRGTELI